MDRREVLMISFCCDLEAAGQAAFCSSSVEKTEGGGLLSSFLAFLKVLLYPIDKEGGVCSPCQVILCHLRN